jgi:1,2-phenylacetyl-CoA epoxidase catalytic subunit
MSQDEFGHLRLLHACLNTQFNDHPQDLLEHRAFAEFSNVSSLDQPLGSWADFVAVNLLTDGALTVLLTALQHSSFEPVANFVDKMVEEEKHHVRNAQGWFHTLATHSSQTQAALEESCRRVLAATLEWLGPEQHDMMHALEQDGIINTSWESVRQHFFDWIGPFAETQRIALGIAREGQHWHASLPIDFSNWNPLTRRCTASQPDEKLLYHLTGSKNAIFKLGES